MFIYRRVSKCHLSMVLGSVVVRQGSCTGRTTVHRPISWPVLLHLCGQAWLRKWLMLEQFDRKRNLNRLVVTASRFELRNAHKMWALLETYRCCIHKFSRLQLVGSWLIRCTGSTLTSADKIEAVVRMNRRWSVLWLFSCNKIEAVKLKRWYYFPAIITLIAAR